MAEHKYYLTVGKEPKGRLLAIITQGHGQFGDQTIICCTLKIVKNVKEAKKWYKKMIIEKPWETRN